MEDKVIQLRWIEADTATFVASMLMEKDMGRQLKDKILEKMGINRVEGDTFADAWLRAMSVENNLEFTHPVNKALADAISDCYEASRFLFFLA